MAEITHQAAQRAAMLLTASLKSVTFYPQAHPAVRQPLQELSELFEGMLQDKPELHLGVVEGVFFLESQLFVTPNASVSELAGRLVGKGVDALTIYRGVTTEHLFCFVSLLARRDLLADQLFAGLERDGVTTIRRGIDQLVYGDSDEGEDFAPSQTYHDAIHAVRETMREIENGRIPTSDRIKVVVDKMVSMTMKDQGTLLGLAMIKDYDNYTFNHSVNVGILALALAAFLGLDREALRDTNTAGLLHDVGKTRIDKGIVTKPGKLSAAEYEQMKLHAEQGAAIVREMGAIDARVADAVLGHHIKYNRTGYPEWARQQDFGPMAEILAVADCYDAITTLRTYNVPSLPKTALDLMGRLSGTSLNGELVDKFIEMMGKFPVGTLVRLDNNEIGLVVRPHPQESVVPALKVIIDAEGKVLAQPKLVSLVGDGGRRYATIVATVDPLTRNIDVSCYALT
jgi:putative nucleotidyltransferase with HDIG domain